MCVTIAVRWRRGCPIYPLISDSSRLRQHSSCYRPGRSSHFSARCWWISARLCSIQGICCRCHQTPINHCRCKAWHCTYVSQTAYFQNFCMWNFHSKFGTISKALHHLTFNWKTGLLILQTFVYLCLTKNLNKSCLVCLLLIVCEMFQKIEGLIIVTIQRYQQRQHSKN